ncbi:MAG: hypothetical protein K9G11_03050 [Rickettsiaceae bacterium]|nr:hypothetical protein [Rickettsiaceae bacterium]
MIKDLIAMKKFLLLPCLLITLLSLNNCTNYIRGDITTFSDGFFVEPGTKIIVVPITTAQQNSIEFRTYQNLLSKFLAQNAFNIVSGKDIKPDMVATLSYDIDEGRMMRYIDYEPVNRVKGYVDETVGYYEYGRYYQRTEKRPITELGFEKVIRTKFVYTANINIEIKKVQNENIFEPSDIISAKTIYSGKIITQSQCGRFNTLFPKMLEMYFKKFPRESSSTMEEKIEFNCK